MEDLLGSYNNGQGDFFMRKKWKYYIDRMLTFALIGILLPLFITIICQRMRLEEVIYGTYDAITETAEREGGEELSKLLYNKYYICSIYYKGVYCCVNTNYL